MANENMENAIASNDNNEQKKAPSRKKKARVKNISTINWMGTLILMSIPGLNVIAAILFLIFGKSPSKKHYALAWLLLMILLVIAIIAVLMVLPDQATDFADTLREFAAPTATPPVWA